MTVAELIAELQKRPPESPVYLWDTRERFRPAKQLSYPAGAPPKHDDTRLPVGAVVIWWQDR